MPLGQEAADLLGIALWEQWRCLQRESFSCPAETTSHRPNLPLATSPPFPWPVFPFPWSLPLWLAAVGDHRLWVIQAMPAGASAGKVGKHAAFATCQPRVTAGHSAYRWHLPPEAVYSTELCVPSTQAFIY